MLSTSGLPLSSGPNAPFSPRSRQPPARSDPGSPITSEAASTKNRSTTFPDIAIAPGTKPARSGQTPCSARTGSLRRRSPSLAGRPGAADRGRSNPTLAASQRRTFTATGDDVGAGVRLQEASSQLERPHGREQASARPARSVARRTRRRDAAVKARSRSRSAADQRQPLLVHPDRRLCRGLPLQIRALQRMARTVRYAAGLGATGPSCQTFGRIVSSARPHSRLTG
jgi:hypothetical protein